MRLLIQRLLFETVVGEKVALLESLTGLVVVWNEGGRTGRLPGAGQRRHAGLMIDSPQPLDTVLIYGTISL